MVYEEIIGTLRADVSRKMLSLPWIYVEVAFSTNKEHEAAE